MKSIAFALVAFVTSFAAANCPDYITYKNGNYLKYGTTFYHSNGNYLIYGSNAYYRNGNYLKYGTENLYYPSGNYLKYGQNLYYPNGNYMRYGTDYYYYPSGNYMKYGSNFYHPNGNYARYGTTLYEESGSVTVFPLSLFASIGEFGNLQWTVRSDSEMSSIDLRGLMRENEVKLDDVELDEARIVFHINDGNPQNVVHVTLGPNGIEGCVLDSEPVSMKFDLENAKAAVEVTVKPGADPEKVRQAIQAALDSL